MPVRKNTPKSSTALSQITALCSILVLIIVIYAAVTLIPKANTTFQNLNLIMEDLDTITSDLAEADLGGMISDIDLWFLPAKILSRTP